MADPLERLTNLVALLLETKLPLTFEQIVDALAGQYPAAGDARRAAFERDKALLRAEGIPLETLVMSGEQAGATAYRIDRARYELPDLDLTDEERRALELAVATVRLSDRWADDALLKVGDPFAAAPATGQPSDAGAVLAHVPALPALPALVQAQLERASVRFRYRGAERTLDPYGVLLREGRWYVSGHDHASGERRTFRVDRIEGTVELGSGGGFEPPAGFDPSAALPGDPKLLGDDEEVVATVRVDAERAPWAVRELGEGSVVERNERTVTLRVAVRHRDAFRSWVLGLAEHAEVVGPPELRAQVAGWLEAMVAAR